MNAPPTTAIAPDALRRVCSYWTTGIAVITGNASDGSPRGLAVNSFTSLSLDPPLILFAPAASSTTWPDIKATGRFAVNILSAEQAALAQSFARSGGDKFSNVSLLDSDDGMPHLAGAMARLVCDVEMVYAGGDHDIVVGRVLQAEQVEEATPLLFYRGRTVSTVENLSPTPTPG
ncbi:flavin reductase family protein [Rhodococcus sp. NPDC127530]|uniref:flavin reductase family protein n=1 Tax=unclassified Rhodococcus (in: high G+C Gram-positive bacteria) TaxID=192944 RepID=UPI003637BFD0